ncbi:MAG: hypothetical protein ABSA18_14900 [Dehalococcoidia bacterium]
MQPCAKTQVGPVAEQTSFLVDMAQAEDLGQLGEKQAEIKLVKR